MSNITLKQYKRKVKAQRITGLLSSGAVRPGGSVLDYTNHFFEKLERKLNESKS